MGCQCPRIPDNVMIVEIDGSEVGIVDLRKIIKDIHSFPAASEAARKAELLRRCREMNHIPDSMETIYLEALWGEYLAYARSRRPVGNKPESKEAVRPGGLRNFLSKLTRNRSSNVDGKKPR